MDEQPLLRDELLRLDGIPASELPENHRPMIANVFTRLKRQKTWFRWFTVSCGILFAASYFIPILAEPKLLVDPPAARGHNVEHEPPLHPEAYIYLVGARYILLTTLVLLCYCLIRRNLRARFYRRKAEYLESKESRTA